MTEVVWIHELVDLKNVDSSQRLQVQLEQRSAQAFRVTVLFYPKENKKRIKGMETFFIDYATARQRQDALVADAAAIGWRRVEHRVVRRWKSV